MRKTVVALVVLLFSLATHAQQQPTSPQSEKVDIYAGWSIMRYHSFINRFDPSSRIDTAGQGWNTGMDIAVTQHLGLTADVARYYPALNGGAHANTTLVLFGPNLRFILGRRHRRVMPVFAHALIGVGHANQNLLVASIVPDNTDTARAYALGGGLDLPLTSHLAMRSTIDYVHTRFFGEGHNESRVLFGLVVRVPGTPTRRK